MRVCLRLLAKNQFRLYQFYLFCSLVSVIWSNTFQERKKAHEDEKDVLNVICGCLFIAIYSIELNEHVWALDFVVFSCKFWHKLQNVSFHSLFKAWLLAHLCTYICINGCKREFLILATDSNLCSQPKRWLYVQTFQSNAIYFKTMSSSQRILFVKIFEQFALNGSLKTLHWLLN